ncbi:TonB-dependent siderophore receptor [Paracoccus sp. S3-43]|uniref:TonB-dependent siderophore receptor n=1 Tax=Paracoccus sp. S3-43 TaxID=3030011 RepID=UPI0023AF1C1E|nr:TonB-dependent siderophore receptor [Paracoccus sp. S3-43]WEF24508.1 TonB-dependent siderophore receptor [Paracoccus sp. S3-43]
MTPRSLILASVSALALAHPALAQDPAPAASAADDSVFVLGDITLTVDDVAGYFANGAQTTKSATPISEAQQSVTVVTNDQITEQGAENLGEALGYTAGVLAEPYGHDPRFDEPIVRGFSARQSQYVNGLRQGRFFGAVSQEIYGLQQIEILRGPSSSLYGAGSPMGIINMVQKRAQSGNFGEVGLGYDSNESSKLFFDVNRSADDTLAFRMTGIGRDDSTQIEDLTNKGGYLAGAARWTPDAATTIDVLANYTKDAPISPAGVAPTVALTGDGEYLRDLYTGQKDWDESDRTMYSVGVEVSHEMESGWTLSQGLRYEKLDWDYRGTYPSDSDTDTIMGRGSSRQRESSNTISLDTRLSGQMITGQVTHQLLFGADIRRYEADQRSEWLNADPLDLDNPDYHTDTVRTPWYVSEGPTLYRQAGLYAQDELIYGKWRGTLGLRYDWVEQTGAYSDDTVYKDNKVTGRAGVSYLFDNGMMPYVSYSTSFDPVTSTQNDGTPLKPTEGKQWEAGVKYRPQSFDGLITATIYDLENQNVTYRDAADNRWYQVGKVKSRGLELEATAEIAAGWDIRASYAYNSTEQSDPRDAVNDGKEMPNAPRHLASVWLDRDFGNGFRVGGGIRYIGSRYYSQSNEPAAAGLPAKLDDVTLVDLGASYSRDNYRAKLNISNLTDEVYLGTCGFSYCAYGEGRTVTAEIAYTW